MAKELTPLPEDWERALAIVAHPDDLEYEAASAVARWTSQGKQVCYLLVTRGEAGIDSMPPDEVGPLREEEERKGAAIVGVANVEFLQHQDGIIEYGLPLRRDIASAIRRRRPHILITLPHHLTWKDGPLNMADHRWVTLAVMDAARDAGNRWIFPELLSEGFEPWHGVGMVCLSGSPYPTHTVDVSEFIEKGIASLEQHRVYLENLPEEFDVISFVRGNMAEMGIRAGCKYAVSFEVIKT
ncbi:MAG: PIG-L deacetylase family protein [Nitrospinota bacterium]